MDVDNDDLEAKVRVAATIRQRLCARMLPPLRGVLMIWRLTWKRSVGLARSSADILKEIIDSDWLLYFPHL